MSVEDSGVVLLFKVSSIGERFSPDIYFVDNFLSVCVAHDYFLSFGLGETFRSPTGSDNSSAQIH